MGSRYCLRMQLSCSARNSSSVGLTRPKNNNDIHFKAHILEEALPVHLENRLHIQ